MTDEVANLILEQIKLLRRDAGETKASLNSLQSDLRRVDQRLSAVEAKVDALADDVAEIRGALSGVAYWTAHNTNEVLAVKERLDRLEARPAE